MTLDTLFEKPSRASQCRFGREYDELDETDRQKLRTAFLDTEITTTWIWTVLAENGFTVSESTVRTHRKGNCRTCGKIA
jgi:hypothetical protein